MTPDRSVDWEVCRRTLAGIPTGRLLTMGERATVYRAVIAGGGSQSQALGLMRMGGQYLNELLAYIESTGGMNGFPVVDGVTLMWSDPDGRKAIPWR